MSLGVERSHSQCSSPVVLVLKKVGTIRFCIHFRKFNSQSKFDAYPTPRLDDLIERVGKAQYISTLDLCKGYWQVHLSQEARQYTAFRTPQSLFQFTVMPFGLQGALATGSWRGQSPFQRPTWMTLSSSVVPARTIWVI